MKAQQNIQSMSTTKLIFVTILFLTTLNSFAWINNNSNNEEPTNNGPFTGAEAGCTPATAIIRLDFNNVDARIENGGLLHMNRSTGRPDYIVPKGGNASAIFASGLWMGGQDVNGQLKLAATRYRAAGDNFWPGPLNTTTAEIDAATCSLWDKFFPMGVNMVKKFVAWYECKNTPGCDLNADFPGYQIPKAILEWPAHGDVSLGQDFYLAPFYDRNGDGIYDPVSSGDYPYYDFLGIIDCRKTRDIRLFGDTTYWWIFNDKGNNHQDPVSPSIGMEIHAQAFAFATNDEVNNMTFYNYQLINRSTFTLANTFFAQYADADLGCYNDDYVGCDVERGLGFCYNGNAVDITCAGSNGYGAQPPAIGIDFFEGPYQDNDSLDNPLTSNIQTAISQKGIPYKGLGLGYGDGVIDNERFGMRKFVYYNNDNSVTGDPQTALDYYNYMNGIWKDGTKMQWDLNGHATGNLFCDYMFPGNSDPLWWGTGGNPASPALWTEETVTNIPADRRFLQSAGPFTLKPGAVNDITVGYVWARALSGGPYASVEEVRVADDKAQALFDNCFKILSGPDAPDMEIQELDKELIIYLKNPKSSNNYNENYIEKDPFIVDTAGTLDVYFRFEGYQIFQVKNKEVSVSELNNPDKARLVAQCDVQNGVKKLVNFTYDASLNGNVPQLMVDGEDKGIRHSFKINRDKFALGNDRLINHKKYYYIAIAYSYNNYKTYDPLDPNALDGQKKPYLSSRKSATGSVRIYSGIPHIPQPEANGTVQNADYGDEPQIKRMEGKGNSGIALDIIAEDETTILNNYKMATPTYKAGNGPISVKVIDPLNVPAGTFTVKLRNDTGSTSGATNLSKAYWIITEDATGKTITADKTISVQNEQLILDWGLSVSINNFNDPGIDVNSGNGFIEATMTFADSSNKWLTGLSDGEGATYQNWILAGEATFTDDPGTPIDETKFNDILLDINQYYEKVLSGTWGPYRLARSEEGHAPAYKLSPASFNDLKDLPNVDIVITDDKSKWTRCPVFETQDQTALAIGGAARMTLRKSPSVNKEGQPDGSGTGMGWFPGYAIDLDKGIRLNIGFGEDSWLGGENGSDMMWNPTTTLTSGPFNSEIRWGGKHYIYIFREANTTEIALNLTGSMPMYDQGDFIYNKFSTAPVTAQRDVFRFCSWVGIPLLSDQQELLNNDVRIRLRVNKAYRAYDTQVNENQNIPWYTFNTDGIATTIGDQIAAKDALKLVNVVPNPYYAYSDYEESKFDNIVKVTNLPEECTVSIYNLGGTLIRRYQKADPSTSLNWDLQNNKGVPVAGGVYLIHVNVEGVGEKTLKLFTVTRPTDVSNF